MFLLEENLEKLREEKRNNFRVCFVFPMFNSIMSFCPASIPNKAHETAVNEAFSEGKRGDFRSFVKLNS